METSRLVPVSDNVFGKVAVDSCETAAPAMMARGHLVLANERARNLFDIGLGDVDRVGRARAGADSTISHPPGRAT